MKTLAEKIQQKENEKSQQIQDLTKKNLELLSENLVEYVQTKNRSLVQSIDQNYESLEKKLQAQEELVRPLLFKQSFAVILSSVMIFAVICSASWGAMRYFSKQTKEAHLEYKMEVQKRTLIKAIPNVKDVVETQIWVSKEPRIFQSREGFWVIETER